MPGTAGMAEVNAKVLEFLEKMSVQTASSPS